MPGGPGLHRAALPAELRAVSRSSGENSLSLAAASSIARGSPSSRAHISATTPPRWHRSIQNSGRASCARSTNRRTAQSARCPPPWPLRGRLRGGTGAPREQLFAADPQRLTARHQDLEVRAEAEELGHVIGRRYDLLEVVEEEERRRVPNLFGQGRAKLVVRRDRGVDGLNDGLEGRLGTHARRTGPRSTRRLGSVVDLVGSRLERKAASSRCRPGL